MTPSTVLHGQHIPERPAHAEVGVVMAVYNGEEYLLDAVRSVLAQTHSHLQLVIVDDGSTDSTPNILESLDDSRVRVITLARNQGRDVAFETGIRSVTSPYLAFVDADDLVEPGWLEEMVRILGADPTIDFVTCPLTHIAQNGTSLDDAWIPLSSHAEIAAAMLDAPSMQRGGSVGRTAVFEDLDLELPVSVAEDYAMWARMLVAGRRFASTRSARYLYRQHPEQAVRKERRAVREAHRLVQAELVQSLWPERTAEERAEITDWLHWRFEGRTPQSVQDRRIMDRSLRVSRLLVENTPAVFSDGGLDAYREQVIAQELIAWGGRARLAELLRCRREMRARELVRCLLRSVTSL